MRCVRPSHLLIAALPFALVPAAHAFEPTGSAVADAFLSNLEVGGFPSVTVEGVERDGTTTRLAGVEAAGAADGETLTIGTVTIEDGVVAADNALVAERITYDDLRAASVSEAVTRIDTAVVDGARLAVDPDGTVALSSLAGSFDAVTAQDLSATSPDGQTLRLDRLSASRNTGDEGGRLTGSMALSGLTFDVALLGDAGAAQLGALGYDEIRLDATASGAFAPETGGLVLDDVTMEGAGIGALRVGLDVDGVSALSELGGNVVDLQSLLVVLQGVNVSRLSVRYTDDGLAERLLSQISTAAGLPRESVVDNLVAAIPGGLAMVDDPAFVAKVTEAARTFLEDPGTIALSVAPDSPVNMAEVFGAALVAPASLIDLLDLSVTADP